MGKIKGWTKSKKYDGSNPSKMVIYQSDNFPKETWVTIGLVGKTNRGYWSITDKGISASFQFDNYKLR